jgi:hypothetical protein
VTEAPVLPAITHTSLPVHPPLQPTKIEPVVETGTRVTAVEASAVMEQSDPQ